MYKLISITFIIVLLQCSSGTGGYDLISHGVDTQYQLRYASETNYFESLRDLGLDYQSRAFFVEYENLSMILFDLNNRKLNFYIEPSTLTEKENYLLWEFCGSSKESVDSDFLFFLNDSRIEILASLKFDFPYEKLGQGKKTFFPRKKAEEYVQSGFADGVLACNRYILISRKDSYKKGQNIFSIRFKPDKIMNFKFLYDHDFVRRYKPFFVDLGE
ncbi:hypothetical protein EHQ81_12620 [Leptospira selangorensis]|uniref:Uncharacterized protein n=1 Tax=Leptospira selangorensis TaxID=2484982 RepID=A0A5F2C6Q0_9LEPT|nr:hypothetical protein [Leptospira selangorensis]TGM12730.1 hypothetical protein EHQ81_12620 [Leptospira selangorensis]TGM30791.1 hypothetical protein EHQ82_00460 [Leptospira selangorensis]